MDIGLIWPSTSSRLNLWIETLELDARIGGGKLPIDPLLLPIALILPGLGFLAQGLDIRNPSIETLLC